MPWVNNEWFDDRSYVVFFLNRGPFYNIRRKDGDTIPPRRKNIVTEIGFLRNDLLRLEVRSLGRLVETG